MLSAFSKDPRDAINYKWPEFKKPVQAEVQVPDFPGTEGFVRFDAAKNLPKEAPKPVVRNAVFENLKTIDPTG